MQKNDIQPSDDPRPSDAVRAALVGVWRCVTGRSVDAEGRETLRLDGGLLTYLPDGRMHVVVNCDPAHSDPQTLATTGITFGYYGTWAVDAEGRVVTHHLVGSTVPAWRGRALPRTLRLDPTGETLWLRVSLDHQASAAHDWRGGSAMVEWHRVAGVTPIDRTPF